jgi:pyruvate/2-oxoglutarate/acetoin dehydrogenase E1 component/TPP-dependent pyruvate/acetoin dehydrogenase alpha subunit
MQENSQPTNDEVALGNLSVQDILEDYRICCLSRALSLLGRKEVLSGKAKFGIFGDGKEVPQVAMARAFRKGDFRAGYYRDQTFMMALGLCSVEDFLAQMYADAENDPFSGGRQMNTHFATPYFDENENWLPQKDLYNISSDTSATAGQVARAIGFALASKFYRENKSLSDSTSFSDKGNEVCFVTIGDASTSEGAFWETMNAAGVMQVPLVVSVWDDGYGISVPTKYQTTKGSISAAMAGLQSNKAGEGIDIYAVKAWDYPSLVDAYSKGIRKVRTKYKPALFHIKEVTQPQGHSTSGSHERYKSKERLTWEKEYDCIVKMREWILDSNIATEEELAKIKKSTEERVRRGCKKAWKAYNEPIKKMMKTVLGFYTQVIEQSQHSEAIQKIHNELKVTFNPVARDIIESIKKVLRILQNENTVGQRSLENFLTVTNQDKAVTYHKHLYSETPNAAIKVREVKPIYSDKSTEKSGHEIINTYFDKKFAAMPELCAFGEDVGKIGDVNQGFAGLQDKYGEERIWDTGIREWTIMGQGMGMASRGLRPIAEIQYLDYIYYGLAPLADDLSSLRYRTNGMQGSPMIIRTRGHRLEGIWHTGSPMAALINSIRGIYICVPRDFVRAAGMYNTMLQSDDPAMIIEPLNAYRLKEQLPENLDTLTIPLGVPEVLETGTDVTLVTYGSCVRVAQEGMKFLKEKGISVELIDVQTLLPFDVNSVIAESLKKTNRIVFLDEDVPGGATGFMMQEVLEKQNGYFHLDSKPVTITAKAHRPPYGSDGDYYSKPNPDEVFETIYAMMHEAEPARFGKMYFL